VTDIVAMDIGGTHARFAIATLAPGTAPHLSPPVTLPTADYPGLAAAFADFATRAGRPLPRRAALAVACPVDGDRLQLTNNPWVLHRTTLAAELGFDELCILNDFAAIGHAVPQLAPADLVPLCGPATGLPPAGTISIVGPGTGLGVGLLVRAPIAGAAQDIVVPTEGGHIDFAPCDDFEDRLLARLRHHHGRVSIERVCAGPGLAAIHAALAEAAGKAVPPRDDRQLWQAAIDSTDPLAAAALQRFCAALGTAAGNIALAHLAGAVVLAGGIPPRILPQLRASDFGARFRAKGRYEALMATTPVYVCVHPDPGLFGAAAAFAARL
jgi:glucokinase